MRIVKTVFDGFDYPRGGYDAFSATWGDLNIFSYDHLGYNDGGNELCNTPSAIFHQIACGACSVHSDITDYNPRLFETTPPVGNVINGLRDFSYLIGRSNAGSVCFIDTPEAHRPSPLLERIADTIVSKASNGSQVFVSTQNYLFLKLLQLRAAECRRLPSCPLSVVYVDMYERENGRASVVVRDHLSDDNPVLTPYEELLDRVYSEMTGTDEAREVKK
jgi:hypothetical protein